MTVPILEVLAGRHAEHSLPGARTDHHQVALVIEGGGSRGAYSTGMIGAIDELGLASAKVQRDCGSEGSLPDKGAQRHVGCPGSLLDRGEFVAAQAHLHDRRNLLDHAGLYGKPIEVRFVDDRHRLPAARRDGLQGRAAPGSEPDSTPAIGVRPRPAPVPSRRFQ